MPEHYTRNTEHGVLKWCGKCERLTGHLVFDGRIGRCMEHEAQHETKKQKATREKAEIERQNPTLWSRGKGEEKT
jgi:hypothetical protein